MQIQVESPQNEDSLLGGPTSACMTLAPKGGWLGDNRVGHTRASFSGPTWTQPLES